MNESKLAAISDFIEENDGIFDRSIPETIESGEGLYERVETLNKCPECGEAIVGTEEVDGVELAVCEGDCELLPAAEANQYKLQIENVMRRCCAKLGYNISNADVSSTSLPLYAEATVDETLRVNLVCKPSHVAEAGEKLFSDAVRHSRVNVVLVPQSLLDEVHELTVEYPVANFTPVGSLRMLADPEGFTQIIENAVSQRERSDKTISQSAIKDKGLAKTIETNPGAIRTELDYTRSKRLSSRSYRTLGDHFENVCHAALMYLDISTKPLGKSGENIADLAFLFPQNKKKRHGEKILGIVDAKSNSEKDLSDEKIADKHRDYIWQATSDRFTQNAHVAHVFVVFDMAGLEANELDWYRLIEEEYSKAPIDGTMVVLHASALSQMVHIAQSALQRNEVNLSTDGIHEIFRPFFHFREFRENVDSDIRHMTRVDPAAADGRSTPKKENYVDRYKECERLIVVLSEMVEQRYENVTERVGDDEAALDRYPRKRY
jgi:hypothetical protein